VFLLVNFCHRQKHVREVSDDFLAKMIDRSFFVADDFTIFIFSRKISIFAVGQACVVPNARFDEHSARLHGSDLSPY
jgi:hypothetical protein